MKKKEKIILQPSGIAYTVVPKEYAANPYFRESLVFIMAQNNINEEKIKYV